MKYNFDEVIDRSNNRSSKYDERLKKFGTEDVIPLWVADMDFKTAQPIIDACKKKAEEGIWGYTSRPASYFEAVQEWEEKYYGWKPETSHMSWCLGVVQTMAALMKIYTMPGDKVLIQTPVYSEFYDIPEAIGRVVVENPLVEENGSWHVDYEDFERKAKDFGLQEPKGIMLLGVPGCGKSLTAKCVATEWKQPLLRLDIGKVFQAEVGSSENNIRRAIATAEAVAPCVLWIDEIEKGLNVGGERDGGTNSRVFSTILTWMQEKTKPVFVVATANDISQLPPEFLRKGRFDEIFFVDLPTKEERMEILRIHLSKNNQTSIHELEGLADATRLFNGAEIEEAVKESMFMAYVDNPNNPVVNVHHLETACSQIIPLAKTMSEKIRGLRAWADDRARRASKIANQEQFPENQISIKKTKREKDEDTFG